MGGLILLFILGVWFFIAKRLTSLLTTKMQVGVLKKSIQVLVFVLILVAPVADEIIGGFQFRALCEAETQLKYDEDKLANKEVLYKMVDIINLENMTTPANSYTETYTDIKTQKMLFSYKVLHADGGWLSRAIDFNSVHHPYTFDGSCGPGGENVQQLLKKLNVTVTNDPSRN